MIEGTTQINSSNRKDKVSAIASLLSEYVAIPSISGDENKAGAFLMQVCKRKGLHVKLLNDEPGSFNFCASLYPLSEGKPNIVFQNHIDVVPPGEASEWSEPPFSGNIKEGKIYGRGSIDNKGIGIVQLGAIERFIDIAKQEDLPYNVTLLSVSGEETGGHTGSSLASSNFKELFNPVVVIGEGGSGFNHLKFLPSGHTLFGISITEKCLTWIELKVEYNTTGHASVSGAGYANKNLIQGLQRILSISPPLQFLTGSKLMFHSVGRELKGLKGFIIRHLNWWVLRPFLRKYFKKEPDLQTFLCNSITVSHLSNPHSNLNQNAQAATAVLDCRLLPGFTPDDMVRYIRKKIKDPTIQINIIQQGPLALTTTPEAYYEILKQSLQETYPATSVIPILFPASSDNSYYRGSDYPVYGISPIIFSAEQIASIHNVDEHMVIEGFQKGIDAFENFIKRVMKI